jgi:hypothetical protein
MTMERNDKVLFVASVERHLEISMCRTSGFSNRWDSRSIRRPRGKLDRLRGAHFRPSLQPLAVDVPEYLRYLSLRSLNAETVTRSFTATLR